MKNFELETFQRFRDEIISKAYDIGIKYFEHIKGSPISSIFEFISVKVNDRGCDINLIDKLSEYEDILDSFYLTYEEIFDVNIIEELVNRHKNSKEQKED